MNTPLLYDNIIVKNNFITKVYGLLSIQIMTTIIIIIFGHYYSNIIINNLLFLYTAISISVILLLLSFCIGNIYPYNYFILSLFTLSESYIITYLSVLSNNYNIIISWIFTGIIFIILSIRFIKKTALLL